ncbi:Fc.00g073910.m01.CDS01 [Cosmosporella sp. VM-42]
MFEPRNYVSMDLDRRDLRLTDWDGDGKRDIIWVNPGNQNRVSVFLNQCSPGGGWKWNYQSNTAPRLYCPENRGLGLYDLLFGSAKGHDRANLRCAEVDGDGADDTIFIDKWDGNGKVYYNKGLRDIGGSRYEREQQPGRGPNLTYSGEVAGTYEYYPDLDANGRADQHDVLGTFINEAQT